MANNNTNKTPATIKPKEKPGWIRACFGLGSSNKNPVVADRPVIDDDVSTAGGGPRRRLGSRIIQAVKRPWCKKKEKTTSSLLKIRAAKAVGGSTASKVAVVETGSQKSLLVFLDDEALQAQGPIGGSIQEELFDIAEDSTSPACLNQSRSIKEPNNSRPHKSKAINKAIPEEHSKLKDERSLARALSKQSLSKATTRSSKDPLIGMSILIVTLVIMLLCGRICAILCTSVWFYCMPQLAKTTTKSNTRNAQRNNSSVRSEIERKRVVLMGFLERKQNIFC